MNQVIIPSNWLWPQNSIYICDSNYSWAPIIGKNPRMVSSDEARCRACRAFVDVMLAARSDHSPTLVTDSGPWYICVTPDAWHWHTSHHITSPGNSINANIKSCKIWCYIQARNIVLNITTIHLQDNVLCIPLIKD